MGGMGGMGGMGCRVFFGVNSIGIVNHHQSRWTNATVEGRYIALKPYGGRRVCSSNSVKARKTNLEQRLIECTSDPIPSKLVQRLLGQSHSLLLSSPRRRKRLFSRASSSKFISVSRRTCEALNWNSTRRCDSIFLN